MARLQTQVVGINARPAINSGTMVSERGAQLANRVLFEIGRMWPGGPTTVAVSCALPVTRGCEACVGRRGGGSGLWEIAALALHLLLHASPTSP